MEFLVSTWHPRTVIVMQRIGITRMLILFPLCMDTLTGNGSGKDKGKTDR